MSKQSKLKEKQPEKRIPAPKLRREPLPMSISVKHHLPISAEGTATDLTVAELQADDHNSTAKSQLDYSTSQANQTKRFNTLNRLRTQKQSLEQNVYPTFNEKPLPTLASKIDQIVDLDFLSDQDDHDLNDLDLDHNDQDPNDHFLDQDQDDPDDHNDQDDPDLNNYLSQRDNYSLQNSQSSLSSNKKPSRTINKIDLNIQSRFVRVPNSVADQLARQLSPAEEKIFDQVWRLTVGFNREVWRGKIADLMIRTGYSSRATVTKALAGLIALGLIKIEGRDTNPRGRSYLIVDQVKLTKDFTKSDQRSTKDRKLSDLSRDRDQKVDHTKLVEQMVSQVKATNLIKKSTTTHANSNQVVEQRTSKSYSEVTENKPSRPLVESSSRVLKNTSRKNNDSSGYSPSSSSKSDDDENFSQVRLIYQDLTGNHWLVKDDLSYREIAKIPIPYVILGICYSITRASDHQISSLKYCVPSIHEHYELMRAFPHKDLLEIAYRHLVLVKEAQRSGNWVKELR